MSRSHLGPRSLTVEEARARAALLEIDSYDIDLDLTGGDASDATGETFESVTRVRFRSEPGKTFLNVQPHRLHSVTLDGVSLDTDTLEACRIPLDLSAGEHLLEVRATMAYRNDGEGLHRSLDPADGLHYLYGMSFMDAAPSIFACFDQPDLKAKVRLSVTAPSSWTVVGNGPLAEHTGNRWVFAETPPLSTYFITLIAGPWHVVTDTHDGIRLGLSCRASIASALDDDAGELFTITKQCFDEFHRLFGRRYPFGDYHQAFVPEFNAGAMENPGCVTFRDPMVFTGPVTRAERVSRAMTIAHEMAHMWFGNITTPRWWDDLWLNESFAEYLGQRVTADVTQFADAADVTTYVRHPWGLAADLRPSTHPVASNGAADAASALQDFDGISYAKGSSVLRQLNARLGDEIFFEGVRRHFAAHTFGNATMADLADAWRSAGATGLDEFFSGWLRSAGADVLGYDRSTSRLTLTPPVASTPLANGSGPAREHAVEVAVGGRTPGDWTRSPVVFGSEPFPLDAADRPVLIDPSVSTWAVSALDAETLAHLPVWLPATTEPSIRAGIWSALRSTFRIGGISPDQTIEIVSAALANEPEALAVQSTASWLIGESLICSRDDGTRRGRVHAVLRDRMVVAEPASTLQLTLFMSAVKTAGDPDWLRPFLDNQGLPPGLVLDADLRWLVLGQLSALGAITAAELDAELAAAPTAKATVAHAGARAAAPNEAAKEFAWSRFTGEVDVPNYELEAAGVAMWQPGQDDITDAYLERYFTDVPATEQVRQGWMLADAASAFFPLLALEDRVVRLATSTAATPDLDPGLARILRDRADDLDRRIRVSRLETR